MLPVYKAGLSSESIDERRRNLIGFVQGVFRIQDVVETILARATARTGPDLDLYLFEPADAARASLVYFHPSRRRTSPSEPLPLASLVAGPHWTSEIKVGDAKWKFVAVPIPGGPGIPNHYGAWLVLLGGLIVSAMAAAYIWASGRQSVVALKRANAQLSESIIGT